MSPEERDPELDAIADRLRRARAVPRAGFRAAVRSRLLAAQAERPVPRRRGRLLIAAYGGAGAALLAIAALGAAGAGPLAA
jgi:hypothetical protein